MQLFRCCWCERSGEKPYLFASARTFASDIRRFVLRSPFVKKSGRSLNWLSADRHQNTYSQIWLIERMAATVRAPGLWN